MNLISRPLAYLAAVLAALCVVFGLYARHERNRADKATTALAVSEQANATLKAQVEADQKGMEEERRERTAQEGRLRLAGQEAGRLRRAGEARAQQILQATPPQDQGELISWAVGQAQDLNRRLEAAP